MFQHLMSERRRNRDSFGRIGSGSLPGEWSMTDDPSPGPKGALAFHLPNDARQQTAKPDFRMVGADTRAQPGVHVHDFDRQIQENRARVRAAAAARPDFAVNLDDADEVPPVPDLHQRAIHIPTRTSSFKRPRPFDGATIAAGPNGRSSGSGSVSSMETFETRATSILPPLQVKGPPDGSDNFAPLSKYDADSYDLVAPADSDTKQYSLERRAGQLFSKDHLRIIFEDPALLLRFTSFLSTSRPQSIPVLIHYLDATKALKAINYANAIAESLEPIDGQPFTSLPVRSTVNATLEDRANQAFDVLVRDELPAYITHTYTRVVSQSITKRITGTMPPQLREASEGLAEVFCLTDPNRPDNPIIFASEEFHRTTQYGMSYAIGRNCRFLQGPRTNPYSVSRLRDAVAAGREQCEVFLNYRRDGSPFMNLLMIAPLCDSRGEIRYHIGAQVDVSGIVKECTDLPSLRRLVNKEDGRSFVAEGDIPDEEEPKKDEFQELSEMFNFQELDTVRRWGGRMHRDIMDEEDDPSSGNWHKPRLLISEPTVASVRMDEPSPRLGGRLSGVYQHYLLVRPYPSLRILFASPSLRLPGILQSPFMAKIGGSARVKEELTQALAEGRGVTAKVRWVSKVDDEGRNRWIHCTPLLGSNCQVGVWMVVVVDDEKDTGDRRWRRAPPVDMAIRVGKRQAASEEAQDRRGRQEHHERHERRDRQHMRSPDLISLTEGNEDSRAASPAVRMYNQPISLDDAPSLDLERPSSKASSCKDGSTYSLS